MTCTRLHVLLLLTGCSFSLDLSGPNWSTDGGAVRFDGAVLDRGVEDASVEDAAPGDAAPLDALPADAGDAASVDMTLPIDMAPACAPGERLGECSICGPAGTPTVPDGDPTCPLVACPTRYALFDGFCVEYRFAARMAGCVDAGSCPDRPVECGPADAESVVTASACARIEGCEGDVPPEVLPEDEGTPCNGEGTCDGDGRCSLPEACVFLGEGVELCSGRYDNQDRAVCVARVQQPEGALRSCTAICSDIGATCQRARIPLLGGCNGGDPVSCDLLRAALICHCIVDGF